MKASVESYKRHPDDPAAVLIVVWVQPWAGSPWYPGEVTAEARGGSWVVTRLGERLLSHTRGDASPDVVLAAVQAVLSPIRCRQETA